MQVNKHFFFGEALYRLSVYEKGRCTTSKILWSKKYVTQLVNSINFMEELVQSLSDENITSHDYEIVIKCIENKEIFGFNKLLLSKWQENNYALSSTHNISSYNEVNQLMRDIIEQLKQSIKSLNKKNKQKIWYLLQALHNLPKVYLNREHESIFDYTSSSITIDIALKCAQRYLKWLQCVL